MLGFIRAYKFLKENILDIHQIENDLRTQTYSFEGEKITLDFFYRVKVDSDIYICVPPHYPTGYDSQLPIYNSEGDTIDISFRGNYRNEEQKFAVESLLNSKSAILKAIPGFGKTFCAIKTFSSIKKKTLIIVDSQKLRNQWIESITKFTNLTTDDIGILSGRDSLTKSLTTKPVVIATIQTLASLTRESLLDSKYIDFFKKCNFGVTFIDEMHKILGTPFFSRAFIFLNTDRVYGLSATPKKNDEKLTKILGYYFKDFINPLASKRQPIKILQVKFNSGLPAKTLRYITFKKFFDVNKYIKQLIKKREEFRNILSYIYSTVVSKEDKNTLSIGHTIELLKYAQDIFKESCSLDESNIGTIISESEESEKAKQHIFSTYKMCTAGLSIDHSNTLVLLSPVSKNSVTLEQVTGRVTRDHTSDKESIVIDLVDTAYGQLETWAGYRKEIYKEIGLDNIHEVDIDAFKHEFHYIRKEH